jgi:pyridinium-3,5-biscarboxylic acid mononucleotide sulfurtransferase
MTESAAGAGAKYAALLARLRPLGGAVVAFSGGVDSALLLFAAREALGDRALAVSGRSPSFPWREHEHAVKLAEALGARHASVDTDELSNPEYAKNPASRCFVCKSTLFARLKEVAAREGLGHVLEGSNADDRNDYRPGMKAAEKLGVLAPLMEVGLTKAEIRELARERGIPVWDRPSLACLSSRIPYGSLITEERLARIDAAEEHLRANGFRQVRVRDHGPLARIEVEPAEIPRLLDGALRANVAAELKRLGWKYVSIDLEGYRTGAMNEAMGGS